MSHARMPLNILESNNISLAIQQQKKGWAIKKTESMTNGIIQKREY